MGVTFGLHQTIYIQRVPLAAPIYRYEYEANKEPMEAEHTDGRATRQSEEGFLNTPVLSEPPPRGNESVQGAKR